MRPVTFSHSEGKLFYATPLNCNACVLGKGKVGLNVLWVFHKLMDYTLQLYFFTGNGRYC